MPTKRRGQVWLGLILLVGGIAAAGYGYTIYYRAHILDKSPLTDSPCAPPCWQGMTPGDRITPEEAAQRIRQVPSVGVVADQNSWARHGIMSPTRIMHVSFEWLWWPGSRAFWEPSNFVRIEEDTLVAIHLYLNYKVTVEDILARFGTPPAVWPSRAAIPDSPVTKVSLHYPELGMELLLEDLPYFEPVLKRTTRVTRTSYSKPESFEEWVARSSQQSGFQWYPWAGYGSLVDLGLLPRY